MAQQSTPRVVPGNGHASSPSKFSAVLVLVLLALVAALASVGKPPARSASTQSAQPPRITSQPAGASPGGAQPAAAVRPAGPSQQPPAVPRVRSVALPFEPNVGQSS